LNHRICPKCGAHLWDNALVCPTCQTGITENLAEGEEGSPEGTADARFFWPFRTTPVRDITTPFQKRGVHCGIVFGLLLGFVILMVGVGVSDARIVLLGLTCGLFSAIFGALVFGACTVILGFILDAMANRLNPERRAFIQKVNELAERDDEGDDFAPPDEAPDSEPQAPPENNSTDITPDGSPIP
jgi:hypothetical protein